jgi:hypothetical protein
LFVNIIPTSGTLIYRILFLLVSIMILSVMLTDFIYLVGNTIARQSFHSLDDINTNDWKVFYVAGDLFIPLMLLNNRYIMSKSYATSSLAFTVFSKYIYN